MTAYTVSLSAMSSSQEAFSQIASTISAILAELETMLLKTLHTWTGEAQAAYWRLKNQWDAKAADMPRALQAGEATIGSIAHNYGAAERVNTALFGA